MTDYTIILLFMINSISLSKKGKSMNIDEEVEESKQPPFWLSAFLAGLVLLAFILLGAEYLRMVPVS